MAIIYICGIVDHPSTKEKNHVSENYYVQIISFPPIKKKKKKRDTVFMEAFSCVSHTGANAK